MAPFLYFYQMQTFNKSERLNNKVAINNLFEKGQSVVISPFRLLWIENDNTKHLKFQILILVPKRNISLAAKRNVIKRRINEAFRLNKDKVYAKLNERNKQINIAIIYQKKETERYKTIEQKINLLLTRLIEDI